MLWLWTWYSVSYFTFAKNTCQYDYMAIWITDEGNSIHVVWLVRKDKEEWMYQTEGRLITREKSDEMEWIHGIGNTRVLRIPVFTIWEVLNIRPKTTLPWMFHHERSQATRSWSINTTEEYCSSFKPWGHINILLLQTCQPAQYLLPGPTPGDMVLLFMGGFLSFLSSQLFRLPPLLLPGPTGPVRSVRLKRKEQSQFFRLVMYIFVRKAT